MKFLVIILLVFAVARCATTGGDVPPDIAEATSDVPPSDNGAPPPTTDNAGAPPSETSEADLQSGNMADNSQAAQPPATPEAQVPPPDQNVPPPPGAPADLTQNPPPPENPPAAPGDMNAPPQEAGVSPPVTAENPPPPEVAPPPPETNTPPPSSAEATGEPATITGLDYKANVNGGTIVVRTDKPVQYTTRRNDQNNQFIIDLKNTAVPKRFRRPYTTKEFPGAIASINAYQSKGAREGHVVVQLRDNVEPQVSQDGSVLTIAGGGMPGPTGGNVAANGGGTESMENAPSGAGAPPAATKEAAAENASEEGEGGEEGMSTGDKKVLTSHTLADFLTGNSKFYGRPISLEVKDSDIRDVFRFISEETGLNLVVGDDVSGKVTLKLRRIPWDQALSIILQSNRLGYVKQGNVLRIATLKRLQEESDAARNVIDAQRQLEPLHVQVFPISYAKAIDMEGQAKDFLSPRGKAKADTRTNNLVVTDIDENLSRIRQLVKRLDTQTPEVLIEAKIVEAREAFQRVVGLNWNFTGDILPVGANANNGAPVTFQPNFTQTNPLTSFASAGFTINNMDIFGNLTATLQLLESEQLVKVISAPRIVTLDRFPATIQQTTQFPIFSSAAGVGGQVISTVTFQDVKLELDVTPQITMDGSIIMDVHVTREFPDAPTQVGQSSARAINKRDAKTQVLVENGDTVVIGGIYQSDVTEGEQGIPWLRKIPVIGWLFKNKALTKEKNELIIFLTPRTLNREKAFTAKQGDTSS